MPDHNIDNTVISSRREALLGVRYPVSHAQAEGKALLTFRVKKPMRYSGACQFSLHMYISICFVDCFYCTIFLKYEDIST